MIAHIEQHSMTTRSCQCHGLIRVQRESLNDSGQR
jgi:hypothetical protein